MHAGLKLRVFIEDHPRSAAAVFLGLAALLPWLPFGGATNYVLRVSTLTLLYMTLAIGLNFVPGFTGLLDLGFVGFYGVGAYTAGLLMVQYNVSFWVALPVAAMHSALWGVLRAAPTLRLTGDYFAIVTFGFSELVVLVIRNELWLTRGPMGIPGIEAPTLFGYALNHDWEYFYLMLILLFAAVVVSRRLENSRLGRAWFAIREDEIAAEASGIHIARYKTAAFAVSAAIGGAAGAFYAGWFHFLHPDMFKFWESILILCLVVLGGMGSITGVMLGAAILIPLTEVLRAGLGQVVEWTSRTGVDWISPDIVNARYLIFGLLLVIMMRFRPAGLFPTVGVTMEMHPACERTRRQLDENRYGQESRDDRHSLD